MISRCRYELTCTWHAVTHFCDSSVLVLERLTDDDIAQILTHAVQRANPPTEAADATSAPALQRNDTYNLSDRGSSPPPSSLTLPSSQDHNTDLPPSSPSIPPTDAAATSSDAPRFSQYPQLTPKVFASLVSLSAGDARTALSLLELVLLSPPTTPPDALLASLRQSVSTSYDRTGDARYDMISALHKSVRGSCPDAALYWLARMLVAGEDPVYVARRMVVCASEDVGLADNHALPLVRPLRPLTLFSHRDLPY